GQGGRLVGGLRSRRPAAAGELRGGGRAEALAVRRHRRRAGVQGNRRVDPSISRRGADRPGAHPRRGRAAAGGVFAGTKAGDGSARPGCARRDRARDVRWPACPRDRKWRGPITAFLRRRAHAAARRGGAMKLRDVLRDVPVRGEGPDVDVPALTADSRLVTPGALFVAVPGLQTDGAKFIAQAREKGAVAVISSADVDDPRAALALIAANFYGRPAEKLQL